MSTIVRWNPIREMAAMQNMIDRMFDDTWRNVRPTLAGNALALDVHETANAYTVTTALPGLNAEQINVHFQDGVLTISGELNAPEPAENTRVLLQERVYGRFSRSVTLPMAVNVEGVEATFENGILTLTLPKAPEAQPRTIPVRTNGTLRASNN
ncbi:MAG: Hsp20/alpha crystallin family protein [bacterium]|nr:Hsp20/alpha crystallin family protein [bacterium]